MMIFAALRDSVVGPSRHAAFYGPTVANGALRTCWTCNLPRPVVIDPSLPFDDGLCCNAQRDIS
jgi:hypothetical protein